jgi:hypothetical protein
MRSRHDQDDDTSLLTDLNIPISGKQAVVLLQLGF